MTYIDGFVVAVPTARRAAYREHAARGWAMLRAAGATRMCEGWGDDVPHGTRTDFHRAVHAGDDETVVFSWIEYPDKATRDAAASRIMADPAMAELAATMPFDGARMIYGGFDVLVEAGAPSAADGYVDGFLIPVPDRDAYVALARRAESAFRDHGATRVVEAWGSDVSPGDITGFPQATQLQDGESVVFSWIEWPSKAARDAGMPAAMADARMQTPPDALPFDGKRMVHGGFAKLFQS
jgi:uncharacterized protein YbaA (DUF1428 family)